MERGGTSRGVSGRFGRTDVAGLLASVILVNLVGSAPTLLTDPDSQWFRSLAKPSIYPPSWAFGVVWTALFTVMGVALYLVWRRRDQRWGRTALVVFAVQMVVNVSWTVAFFGLQDLTLGLVVIVFLWVLVAPMALLFWRVRRLAGVMILPYLAWITFAALLNYRFLVLN